MPEENVNPKEDKNLQNNIPPVDQKKVIFRKDGGEINIRVYFNGEQVNSNKSGDKEKIEEEKNDKKDLAKENNDLKAQEKIKIQEEDSGKSSGFGVSKDGSMTEREHASHKILNIDVYF